MDAYEGLGNLLASQNDPQGAREAYEQGLRDGSAIAAYRVGLIHYEAGDLVAARKAWEAGMDIGGPKPSSKGGYVIEKGEDLGVGLCALQLGNLLYAEGDKPGAILAWKLAALRGSAQAAYNLGAEAFRDDDAEEAIRSWRFGTKLGSGPSAHALGLLFTARGDTENARQAFKMAVELGDSNAIALLQMLDEPSASNEHASST